MLISDRWQSKTAFLMAFGITATAIAPALLATPAAATSPAATTSQPFLIGQLFPDSTQVVGVPAGTIIPVRYDEAERIIVMPDETAEVTLIVAADIRSAAGTVLIPVGSRIEGQLQPLDGGTRFVAQEVVFPVSERRVAIDATSQLITETETISRRSNPDLLRGAAIGAAAGAVLGELFGNIGVVDVVLGAGLGVAAEYLLRGRQEVEVVVVNPETDLDITLRSNFRLN